jgi:hypothetical protein
MIGHAVADRAYTDEELEAAIAQIAAPDRLSEAQNVVARMAPSLQRVLGAAIAEGGWFDSAHEQVVREAAGDDDPEGRLRAVKTLLAEETRLGMLVGVAVGFELSRALEHPPSPERPPSPEHPPSPERPPSPGRPPSPES